MRTAAQITALSNLELAQARAAAITVCRTVTGTIEFGPALAAVTILGDEHRRRVAIIDAAHELAIDEAYVRDVGTWTVAK